MKGQRRFGPLAGFLLTTTLALAALPPAAAQDSGRVMLSGHVIPTLAGAEKLATTRKAAVDESITFTVVLRRSDPVGFARFVADLYNPASPDFRRFLAPREVSNRFGPHADEWGRVHRYFAEQGFDVVEGSDNRMTLTLRGTRGQVEQALAVTLSDYRLGSKMFRAPDGEPSLPASVASHVDAIAGLSDLATPERVPSTLTAGMEWAKACYSGGTAIVCGLAHAFLAVIYNLGCIDTLIVSLTIIKCNLVPILPSPDQLATGRTPRSPNAPSAFGAGQKIGIVAFDSFLTSDVADFIALIGAPASMINQLSFVPVNGGAPLGADQAEVLLDISVVMMLAPNASYAVYSAPFGAGSFQAIFNRMISDGVTVISNSWTYCENQTSFSDVSSIDSIFATAAASGITVLNASGDTGSTCLGFAPNTIGVPAGAPHATAVGGTSAVVGPGGTYGGETYWNGTAAVPVTGQGGFGTSRFFQRPAYQNGLSAASTRSIPDLVVNADPSSIGLPICQASAGGCPVPRVYGGTSASSPVMAAFVAILNEARGSNLGWLNPQLYPLSGSTAFHSPSSLGSDFAHVGLGSPNLSEMHLRLKARVPGTPSSAMSIVHPVSPIVSADGTSETQVAVQLRDGFGSAVPGKTVTLAASAGSQATITPPSGVTTVANGTVLFTVKNLMVQDVTFTATDVTDGVVVAKTATVQFVAPPATAANISAFPTTVLNNGIATTTITVTMQDALARPTPGKVVTLSQGNGRSIITAPSPAVTDVNGQIQFTATNKIAETVTYTAVNVTDGNLPVPGSAVVTFTGQASASCAGAITAAPSFTVTPFAAGFIAEAFSFSNVNWGCAGGSDPTFDPTGAFYVASFRTGELFKLPSQGGATTTDNRLSAPGLTLQRTVFGKDGKLYAARSATGAGFFSGQVLEVDPQTGATLRTLASNLPCVSPPAVDPLSGDLFFTGQCFGAGSDDARLFRISNPGSATPVLSTYATLPGTPNGAVSFAPDGTMFVAITYLAPSPPVVRVSGTNQPQPPTITPVPGVNSVFWVNVGETLANGAAKSLIVNTSDQKLKLADITTDPPTFTELLVTGASTGVVGPDGCLYISNGETIYKLTAANGTCGFTPTTAVPSIALTPAIVTPDPAQGTSISFTAKLIGVPPSANIPVRFKILGAHTQGRLVRTDGSGKATLVHTGLVAGQDVVTAEALVGNATLQSNTARVNWTPGKHTPFLTLNLSPASSVVGMPVTLTAALVDNSVDPGVVIAGATLQFNVAGQPCNAVTNASGVASCEVTVPLIGSYTLTVTYAGNASFLAATDAVAFNVLAAGPPPCSAFNDVDITSIFCVNVEWIRNRSVTLGCQATLYCPLDAVTRLQMAAFMNRLGTALSAATFFVEAQPGAIDLDAEPVICQTSDFATGTFARRAFVDASFSGRSAAGIGFAADAVASFDGGATWVPLAAVGNRAFSTAGQWGHVRASGIADLNPGETVRFGVWVSRGALPGSADLTDSTCKVRAAVGNR
jgi:Pro-kumamolisin, activation domain/Bacterial Ig-like domain (group 1)/Subtilase family